MPEIPTVNDASAGNNVEDVVSTTNVRAGTSRSRRNKRARDANQEDLGTLELLFNLT